MLKAVDIKATTTIMERVNKKKQHNRRNILKKRVALKDITTKDISRMLLLATVEHQGQTRRDGKTPYIEHAIAVAEKVAYYGGTESMVIEALGHDLVEDTEQTVRSLTEAFTAEIAESIGHLTNNKFVQSTFPTKGDYLVAKMKPMSEGEFLIKICDIMHNTEDLLTQDVHFAQRNLTKAMIVIEGVFEWVQAYGKTEDAKELSLYEAFRDLMSTVDNVKEQVELRAHAEN